MLNNIKLRTINDYVQLVQEFLKKLGTDEAIIKQIKTEDFEKGLYIKLPDVCVLKHNNRLDGSGSHQTHIHITSSNMKFFYDEVYINSVQESTDDIKIPLVLVNTNLEYLEKSTKFRRNKSLEEINEKYSDESFFIETHTVKKISKRNKQSPQVQLSKKRKDGNEFKKIRDNTFTRDMMLFLKYKGYEEKYLLVIVPSSDYTAYDETGICEADIKENIKEHYRDSIEKDIDTIAEADIEYTSTDEEAEIVINYKDLKDIDINLLQGVPTYREIPKDIGKNRKSFANKKRDYVNETEKKSLIGNFGERQILSLEKAKLKSQGYKELAESVEWVSEEDDSKGYDILSYEVIDGKIITRYIEVKTTFGADKPFEITENEVEISKELNRQENSKYVIARVFNINTELQTGEYYYIDGAIEENFNLRPILYKAYYSKF